MANIWKAIHRNLLIVEYDVWPPDVVAGHVELADPAVLHRVPLHPAINIGAADGELGRGGQFVNIVFSLRMWTRTIRVGCGGLATSGSTSYQRWF